jgi:L-ascorbate oxidase
VTSTTETPLSVLEDPASTWILTNGSAKSGIQELDPNMLAPADSNVQPPQTADLTELFTINQTDVTIWVLNKSPYAEPKIPVLYGNISDGWNVDTTIHLDGNRTVDLIMQIANDSMDTVCFTLVPACPNIPVISPANTALLLRMN